MTTRTAAAALFALLLASPGTALLALEGPRLRAPSGVAFTGDGRLVVADTGNDRLVVYDSSLHFLSVAGGTGGEPGLFRAPRGLASDGAGRIYVCDSGNSRVQVLDAALRPAAIVGGKDPSGGSLVSPAAIAIDPDGRLFVADAGAGRVVVFGPDGSFAGAIAGPADAPLSSPSGLAYESRTRSLFVANSGRGRVDVFTVGPEPAGAAHRGLAAGTIPGVERCPDVAILSGGLIAALDAAGEVKTYDDSRLGPGGAPIASFAGGSLGRLREPRAIAAGPRGELAIADSGNHRVVIVRSDFATPRRPSVTRIDETAATIEWRSEEPSPSVVFLRRSDRPEDPDAEPPDWDGALAFEGAGGGPVRNHVVRASGLEPGTRYYYRVTSPEATVLPGKGVSGEYALVTRAPRKKASVLSLPVDVVLYSHAFEPADGVAPPPPLDGSAVAAIRREIDEACRFVWINTGFKVFVDVDFRVVERTPADPSGFPSDPLADSPGTRPGVAGVVSIVARQVYRPEKKSWELAPSGGETSPVRWPRPASSRFLAGSDVAWLFAHEFHHQLDSFLDAAGFPEFPHNHFSPSEGNAGRHGDHWDGNAALLRKWPAARWLAIPFGRVLLVSDADGDGVPDDEPTLPLDETRLGSDPARADTDGDGLSDLKEAMTTIGVRSLLTARLNRTPDLPSPSPRNPDADGDGIPDGDDPEPLYAVPDGIPHRSAIVDGRRDGREWSPYFRARSGDFEAEIAAQWDGRNLYFAFVFAKAPAEFAIDFDFGDDGWYVGRDNVSLGLSFGDDGLAAVTDAFVNDASLPGSWPFQNRDLFDPSRIEIATGKTDEGLVLVEIAIPRMPECGLTLVPGATHAVAPSFRPDAGGDWVPAFEPYRLVPFRLSAGGF